MFFVFFSAKVLKLVQDQVTFDFVFFLSKLSSFHLLKGGKFHYRLLKVYKSQKP